jgi:hypothetical protein
MRAYRVLSHRFENGSALSTSWLTMPATVYSDLSKAQTAET